MRTITEHVPERIIPEHDIVTNVYEFSELAEDVKQSVREWYLQTYHDVDFFTEDIKLDLENIFGKNDLDVEYSLGYSQGDGLNVYGKIDARQILNFMSSDVAGELSRKFADVLTDDEKRIVRGYCEFDNGYYHDFGMIEIPQNPMRYSYCCADRIDIADVWSSEMEYCGVDCDYDLLKKFEDAVIDLFTELCKMYEQWGYDYFYEESDEDLAEEFSERGWEFLKSGEVYEF